MQLARKYQSASRPVTGQGRLSVTGKIDFRPASGDHLLRVEMARATSRMNI
jgi:hypothetical protein